MSGCGPRCMERPCRHPKTTAEDRAWTAGFCVALAESHRKLFGGNDSSGVCEVMRDAGITLREAKAAGVPEFDLKELKKAGVR